MMDKAGQVLVDVLTEATVFLEENREISAKRSGGLIADAE
jgi:hypothetical protein